MRLELDLFREGVTLVLELCALGLVRLVLELSGTDVRLVLDPGNARLASKLEPRFAAEYSDTL